MHNINPHTEKLSLRIIDPAEIEDLNKVYDKVKQHLNLTPEILSRDNYTPSGALSNGKRGHFDEENHKSAEGKRKGGQKQMQHSNYF